MTTNPSRSPEELLEQGIAGFRARDIPAFPHRAMTFSQVAAPSNPQVHPGEPRISRRRWGVTLGGLTVAAILVAATISLWPADAWAQVVQAVKKQAWVRFRMHSPEDPKPDQPPVVELWLSSTKQVAAARHPGGMVFLDFEQQTTQRYDDKERTVYLTDSNGFEAEEIASLVAVLESFISQKELRHPETARAKLLSQSRQDVKEGVTTWTDFTFNYQDPRRTPPQYHRIFRVPAGGALPVRMTESWTHDGRTISRVMEMDYPNSGPADLYALNVPRDAKVVNAVSSQDLKSLLKAYALQQAAGFDAYSAVAFRSVVKNPNWKWINEIYKVQHDAAGYTSKICDLDPLMKLSMRVHSGEVTVPEGLNERLEWWKAQAPQLTFKPFEGDTVIQVFVPDRVGYPSLGLPDDTVRATFEPHPNRGPAGTVLVTILDSKTDQIRHCYWLAPERGYLCVRQEHHPASKYLAAIPENMNWIAASIVDSTEQSPTGRWYATQVREGIVKGSSDDLPEGILEGAPYGSTTWRFLAEFPK